MDAIKSGVEAMPSAMRGSMGAEYWLRRAFEAWFKEIGYPDDMDAEIVIQRKVQRPIAPEFTVWPGSFHRVSGGWSGD